STPHSPQHLPQARRITRCTRSTSRELAAFPAAPAAPAASTPHHMPHLRRPQHRPRVRRITCRTCGARVGHAEGRLETSRPEDVINVCLCCTWRNKARRDVYKMQLFFPQTAGSGEINV